MRILFLLLSVMVVASAAEAQVCDPAWLANANYWDAKALLDAGVDANQICNTNRNRPLHQALLNDRADPEVIRALLEAGADPGTQNIHGETPFEYAQDRFDLARRKFRPGTAPYRREQALYEVVVGTFNDQGSAAQDAHAKLCDLNWWRSSASEDAVKELLEVPGVDPNHVCNFNNDRIIHQPLKLSSFAMLTSNIHHGIRAVVDAGADLRLRNNSGQSAVGLAGIRFDRATDRAIQNTREWCNRRITSKQFADKITENGPDFGVVLYIESINTKQPYRQVKTKFDMEIYRIGPDANGLIDYYELCRYRGVNVR